MLRTRRGIAALIFACLAVLGLSVGLAGSASAQDTSTSIVTKTGTHLKAQKGKSTTLSVRPFSTKAAAAHLPGAYILCLTDTPDGIVLTPTTASATFTLVCRWTDDNTFATEVTGNEIFAGIALNQTTIVTSRVCPAPGPVGSCTITYPASALTAGSYRGIAAVKEFVGNSVFYGGPYLTLNSLEIT